MYIFEDKNILVTIFSRKNSKGLPGKHLMPFNGKPLIAWTLDIAKEFAETYECDVLSVTDSTDIMCLSSKIGIDGIRRNPKYATDKAGKVDAIADFYINSGLHYDCIIDLDATNPCRKIEDILNSFLIFKEKEPKTLFSVTKAKKNPYFNQIIKKNDRWKLCIKNEDIPPSRQLSPDVFEINSNIYIYDIDWLENKNNQSVVTDNSEIYLMPDWTFCDIDTDLDFKIAEYLHREHYKEGDVRFKEKDCTCSRGQRIDWFGNGCCSTQARGIYF